MGGADQLVRHVQPEVLQLQQADVLVGADSLLRDGGNVLHPLQFTGLQSGDARARLRNHAEGHRVQTHDLVATEARQIVVARVRRVALEALQFHIGIGNKLLELPWAGAHRGKLLWRRILVFRGNDDDRHRDR